MATFPTLLVPQAFPRIANSNQFGITLPVQTTAATFGRNSLVITNGAGTDPAPLKARNPRCLALLYISTTSIQVNSVSAGVPLFGMNVWPGWWGTLSGTKTPGPMGAADTTVTVVGAPTGGWGTVPFPALISTPSHATDEVVVVTAVSGNLLNITRGAWQSTGQAQPAGARIGQIPAISAGYPLEFYGNITPYCPQKPGTLQRWGDYLASFITTFIYTTYPTYDGIFLDNANTYPLAFPNANLDADSNNVSDGFDGPDGRGVFNGLQLLLSALRRSFNAQATQKLIMTNGAGWTGQSDGMYFESYQKTYGATPPPFSQRQFFDRVRAYAASAQIQPVTLTNVDLYDAGSVAAPGGNSVAYAYNYQALRFGFAQALMGDGYYSFDWCPTAHGQTWSFDEFDKGAGTALTAPVLTTDTALVVASSAGFTNGQLIRVPHAVKETGGTFTTLTEDELMTVNGAPPDGTHINVTRSASVKGGQITGTKVLPDYGAGLPAWLGWMGQALGPAVETVAALGSDSMAALNGGFETSTPAISGAQALASGTYPATDTFANWAFTVQNTGVGFLTADRSVFKNGTQSCRILVPSKGVNSYDVFVVSAGLGVTTGATYTLSWWARGDRQQQYQVRVNNGAGTGKALQQMVMSPVWTQYRLTFAANTTENYYINFEVAVETGNYWFDTVQFQTGDPNIWTRDFENAFAILNGTNAGISVTLPAIANPASGFTTYQKLTGTQDTATNSGVTVAPGAAVTVPALDGLVLAKA